MTQDDMIRMAKEAGWQYADSDDGYAPLWKFAALVAAAERNRIWTKDHWTEYERGIAALEREECAKMCDALGRWTQPTAKRTVDTRHDALEEAAAAIRARGQHD